MLLDSLTAQGFAIFVCHILSRYNMQDIFYALVFIFTTEVLHFNRSVQSMEVLQSKLISVVNQRCKYLQKNTDEVLLEISKMIHTLQQRSQEKHFHRVPSLDESGAFV